mmetsp:Transcript_3338/g.5356  ORF Transcript_3338/g.5356 Transcript_3338/m.5356 type:complete len:211 (+) Transcript_3338:1196-1828(+)
MSALASCQQLSSTSWQISELRTDNSVSARIFSALSTTASLRPGAACCVTSGLCTCTQLSGLPTSSWDKPRRAAASVPASRSVSPTADSSSSSTAQHSRSILFSSSSFSERHSSAQSFALRAMDPDGGPTCSDTMRSKRWLRTLCTAGNTDGPWMASFNTRSHSVLRRRACSVLSQRLAVSGRDILRHVGSISCHRLDTARSRRTQLSAYR